MKRSTIGLALLLAVTVAVAGCGKKEQPPVPPPMTPQPGAGGPGGAPPGAPHGGMGGPAKAVVVPPDVQKSWKAAKLEVEFKDKKSKKQFTIPLNSEFKVPDSGLTVKVGPFLPHFAMTAEQITSGSNKLENPAVSLEVYVDGNPAFKGWLFAKYPDIHPFQHEKYGLRFVEPVKN